jgi:hypothetical protein
MIFAANSAEKQARTGKLRAFIRQSLPGMADRAVENGETR